MSVFSALLKGVIQQTVSTVGLKDGDKLLGVTDKLASGVNQLTKMAKQEAKISNQDREKFHKALEDLVVQYKLTTKLLENDLGATNKSLDSIADKILKRDKLSTEEGSKLEILLTEFTETVNELNKKKPQNNVASSKVVGEYNKLLTDKNISIDIRKNILNDLFKFIQTHSGNIDSNLSNQLSNFKASNLTQSNVNEIAKLITQVETTLQGKDLREQVTQLNKKLDSSVLETKEVRSLFGSIVGKSGKTFREAFKAAPSQFSVGNVRQEVGATALSSLGLGEVDKLFNISGKTDAFFEKLKEDRLSEKDEETAKYDKLEESVKTVTSAVNRVDDSITAQTQLNQSNKGQFEQMNSHLSNLETKVDSPNDDKKESKSLFSKLSEFGKSNNKFGGMLGGVGFNKGTLKTAGKGLGLLGGAFGLYDAVSNTSSTKGQSFFGGGEGEGGLANSRAANYGQATASAALMGATIGSIFPVVGTAIGGALGGLVGASSVFIAENKEKIGKFFSSIGDKFMAIYDNYVVPMIGLASFAFKGISQGFTYISETLFKPVMETANKLYADYVDPALTSIKTLFGAVSDAMNGAWNWLTSIPVVNKFIKGAKSAVKAVTNTVSKTYGKLKTEGQNLTASAGSNLQGAGQSLTNYSMSSTNSAVNAIGSGVGSGMVSMGRGVTNLAMPDMTVAQALQNASRVVGVDLGTLYAMANQESGFNPSAKAGTSSASGLFQFLKGTWSEMVRKYGKQYGFTEADKNDPVASALAGALYIKENQGLLGSKDPTATYAAHFLGPGGAMKLMKGLNSGKLAAYDMPGPAAANKTIFYKKDGSARTYDEVYQVLANKVGNKAASYSVALGSTPIGSALPTGSNITPQVASLSSNSSSGATSPVPQSIGNSEVSEIMTANNTVSSPVAQTTIIQAASNSPNTRESKQVPPKVLQIDDYGIALVNSLLFG